MLAPLPAQRGVVNATALLTAARVAFEQGTQLAALFGSDDRDRGRGAHAARILRILGRALAIRHVDAGSCNACELELTALANPYYNIVLPVDVEIPGCAPTPAELLAGIVAAVEVAAPAPPPD